MLSDTHAGAGVAKPPSRLSGYGLSKTDWTMLFVAILLFSVAVAGSVQLGGPDSSGVLIRLVAPIGAAVVAFGVFQATRALAADQQRAWRLVSLGFGMYAFAVGMRSASSLRIIERDLVTPQVLVALGMIVMGLGVVAMPRLTAVVHTRGRALMDSIAGSTAVGALIWELVRDTVGTKSYWTPLSVGGPVAVAMVLVAAVIFSIMRHDKYRPDRPFRILAIGTVALIAAGVATTAQGGASFENRWPVVLDLIAAACIAVAAVELRRVKQLENATIARLPIWKLVVPYLPVLVLVGVTFSGLLTDPTDIGLLPAALVLVTVASGMSQLFTARENRALVGIERDQLIAAVSHELRVPLTAVTGFSDVLSVGWDLIEEGERSEMVEIIRSQSRYLTGLITDMSSLVRDQLNTVELDSKRLDGKSVIAEAVRAVFDLNVGPLPVKAQVEPYLELFGDEVRIHQILVSLLKNAQRYGGGQILIIAKREGDWRVIEVHDNGPGIPARYESVVWSRFQRGENELNAELPGSGLGLSMVRSLASAHRGTAGYRRSEKLGGACLEVRLPMERAGELEREWLDPV